MPLTPSSVRSGISNCDARHSATRSQSLTQRPSDEAVRIVRGGLRKASLADGVWQWVSLESNSQRAAAILSLGTRECSQRHASALRSSSQHLLSSLWGRRFCWTPPMPFLRRVKPRQEFLSLVLENTLRSVAEVRRPRPCPVQEEIIQAIMPRRDGPAFTAWEVELLTPGSTRIQLRCTRPGSVITLE